RACRRAAADRRQLFDMLARRGFVTGYSGTRVAVTGRRFVIDDVTVLVLADAAGNPAGHAAVIGKTRPEGEHRFQSRPRNVP
ncbi:MAG: MEKHLA domain-containing protein, partial [Planctomycetota bacterium]